MSSLLYYIVRRLVYMVPTLLGAMIVVFVIVRILPGDPARLIAGPEALEQDVESIRRQLGLDRPLYIQFFDYMMSVFRGDLGISIKYRTPVLNEILYRLPYTVALAVVAELIAFSLSIPLGLYSALRPGSIGSYIVSLFSLLGASVPVFWTALLLIYLFAVDLRLLPSGGAESPRHIILPAVTLSLALMGNLVRITRSSVLDVLTSNHVVTAVAKGLERNKILYRHVLRNALIPITTVMGVQFGVLLGGAVITEYVFAWPGIGSLLMDAIFSRDYPLVQGVVMFMVVVFMTINLVVDIVHALLDPRVRHSIWSE